MKSDCGYGWFGKFLFGNLHGYLDLSGLAGLAGWIRWYVIVCYGEMRSIWIYCGFRWEGRGGWGA